ncbi:MAG: pilus assembly protein [Thalassovita sp.]
MTQFKSLITRFRRDEDGNATVQFVVVFPILFVLLAMAFELGAITVREASLERALDQVVRDIRLSTGAAPQHDEIKSQICEIAPIIHDCENSLRLEMVQLDPRNWSSPLSAVDCSDASVDVNPVRNFENGQENELMLLRVCAKVDPVFPAAGLGKQLPTDEAGQYALVATSAFVQEPK